MEDGAVPGHEGLEGVDAVVRLQDGAQLGLQARDGGGDHRHRHRQPAEPAAPVTACTRGEDDIKYGCSSYGEQTDIVTRKTAASTGAILMRGEN